MNALVVKQCSWKLATTGQGASCLYVREVLYPLRSGNTGNWQLAIGKLLFALAMGSNLLHW
jgi:hypothetical protein